jgi:hypothetical protein
MSTPEPSYREIPLTQGQVAIVDAADFEWLNQHKWWAQYDPHTQGYYANTQIKLASKYWPHYSMHRMILGLERGDTREGDHWNGNSLDNRRSNLRITDNHGNGRNQRKNSRNTSGFKGVQWRKDRSRWLAVIRVNGKLIYLGMRNTPEEAYALYCEASKAYHGEFGRVA